MKSLLPFWFTPSHQQKGKPKVEFHLRPLDQRAFLALGLEVRRDRRGARFTAEGIIGAFDYAVISWRGHETEFSEQVKEAVQESAGDPHWALWMKQIADHLWAQVHLEDEAAKNS